MSEEKDLDEICDAYWEFQRKVDPFKALLAGLKPDDFQLLKLSPADYGYRNERAVELLEQLDGIAPDQLDSNDRATYGLLEHELELIRDQFEARSHLRPALFPLGPEFMLNYLADMTGLDSSAKAEMWVEVLRAVPKVFEGLQASLLAGRDQCIVQPRLVIERAIANTRGLFGMAAEDCGLYGPFRKVTSPSAAMKELAAAAVEVLANTTLPALLAYADFLETELLPSSRDSVAATDAPQGDAHYRGLIRQYVTVDRNPEAIHQTGLDEVARLSAEMEAVAAMAGFAGDLAGYRRHLQEDPEQILPSAEALRERIEVLSKRIDGLIPRFIGRIPRTTYGVEPIPLAVAEKMPPAYAQINPADGSAAGFHRITSLPEKCPRYMHLPLALHEAWPGHLMHMAITQELTDLPDFRRYGAFNYSGWSEGWALYCEELGVDMGLYEEPWQHYGRLDMEMWRAVRLVVDTGLHAKGWSRQQAIDYALTYLALPPMTVEAEVDRYIGMPGQALAYQLGKITLRSLRDKAETSLGDDFRLKEFHDAFLGLGPVSLGVMEDLLTDWIEQKRA
jgi:uncharacterized protein (DUF885 family)